MSAGHGGTRSLSARDPLRGWGSHLWYRTTGGGEVAHYSFKRWDGWMTRCGVLLARAAILQPWELRFCGNCARAS